MLCKNERVKINGNIKMLDQQKVKYKLYEQLCKYYKLNKCKQNDDPLEKCKKYLNSYNDFSNNIKIDIDENFESSFKYNSFIRYGIMKCDGTYIFDLIYVKNTNYLICKIIGKEFFQINLSEESNKYNEFDLECIINNKQNSIKNKLAISQQIMTSVESTPTNKLSNSDIANTFFNKEEFLSKNFILVDTYTDVSSNLYEYQDTISDLNKNYNSLNQKYSDLNKNYDSLNQKYSDLNKNYDSLNQKHSDLDKNYNSLTQRYIDLDKSHNSLTQRYSDLDRNYNNLNEKYSDQIKKYSDLNDNYNKLLNRKNDTYIIDKLKNSLKELNCKYEVLKCEYEDCKKYNLINDWENKYNMLLYKYEEHKKLNEKENTKLLDEIKSLSNLTEKKILDISSLNKFTDDMIIFKWFEENRINYKNKEFSLKEIVNDIENKYNRFLHYSTVLSALKDYLENKYKNINNDKTKCNKYIFKDIIF